MEEKDIIDMASKESNYEEVIKYILIEENMDPWDIDIIKLANAFIDYLKKISELDFNVPARIIIIAAVLVRMKADILIWERMERKTEENVVEKIDMSKIPELDTPIKRIPTRKVTLKELISALEKAFKTQEIREEKRFRARRRVEEVLNEEGINIEKKIDELYLRINDTLEKLKKGEMTFSSLVPEWNRKEIIETFLPLLHLSHGGKVTCEQKELFKEIYIKLKDNSSDLNEE